MCVSILHIQQVAFIWATKKRKLQQTKVRSFYSLLPFIIVESRRVSMSKLLSRPRRMHAKGGYERHNGKGERKLNLRRKVLSKVFVSLLRIIKAIGKKFGPTSARFRITADWRSHIILYASPKRTLSTTLRKLEWYE